MPEKKQKESNVYRKLFVVGRTVLKYFPLFKNSIGNLLNSLEVGQIVTNYPLH